MVRESYSVAVQIPAWIVGISVIALLWNFMQPDFTTGPDFVLFHDPAPR